MQNYSKTWSDWKNKQTWRERMYWSGAQTALMLLTLIVAIAFTGFNPTL